VGAGIRRNSYAQYGIGGPQPTDLAGPQSARGDLISGRTSASGSLMEEVRQHPMDEMVHCSSIRREVQCPAFDVPHL
jgi:hypothetical protein